MLLKRLDHCVCCPWEHIGVGDGLGISAHWQRFSPIVSDVFTFAEVEAALAKATTPGAADKVVVTFD
jgi:hypothetical protein